MYCIGIDGGGTKTAFILADAGGSILAKTVLEGIDYFGSRQDGVRRLMENGAKELTAQAGISVSDVAYVCAGIPGIGEFVGWEKECEDIVSAVFPNAQISVDNDVVVGMYGSLAMGAGIHVVSGTGSIAFGRTEDGRIFRTGGWSSVFSDEGSCYWLGVKAFEYYFKEFDNRLPRSFLYTYMRENFRVKDDIELIEIFQRLNQSRSDVAKVQMVLAKAARAGDRSARELYEYAGRELAMNVQAIYQSLAFPGAFDISYSGGLFKTGKLILNPFSMYLSELPANIHEPVLSPVAGAVLKCLCDSGLDRDTAVERLKGVE